MDAASAWERVLLGKVLALERLFAAGLVDGEGAERECLALLGHERGCPQEAADRLGRLLLRLGEGRLCH